MSFWTAAVVIVAILSVTAARIARYRAGLGDRRDHPHGRFGHATPSPREEELNREVEALRDRIAVLERITTDAHSTSERQSRAISEEIESLRDR